MAMKQILISDLKVYQECKFDIFGDFYNTRASLI